jgi:hypothetical protein
LFENKLGKLAPRRKKPTFNFFASIAKTLEVMPYFIRKKSNGLAFFVEDKNVKASSFVKTLIPYLPKLNLPFFTFVIHATIGFSPSMPPIHVRGKTKTNLKKAHYHFVQLLNNNFQLESKTNTAYPNLSVKIKMVFLMTCFLFT